MKRTSDALVLFSGGQDSTTALAWALERFDRVDTIGFDYGQRHHVELGVRPGLLEALRRLRPSWNDRLDQDHLLDLTVLGKISETSLTQSMAIQTSEQGLPNTFVPGRNLIFLTFAAAVAYRRGLSHLVAGVCETDYSGYPDCRDDAIKAMQLALNIGMEASFVLHTPLMWIDKQATWSMAQQIGGEPFLSLIREETHTCYEGDRTNMHDWGYGCGRCPACELRAAGYAQFVGKGDAMGSA